MTAALLDAPLVESGGIEYIVDAETGEVVEVRTDPGFAVTDAKSADWVLGKMLALDAEKAAIESCELVQQARAILNNAAAKVKEIERNRAALEWRFGPELAAWAKTQLVKTRTWKGMYGQVAFRTQPSRLAVVDEDKALAWAKASCPDAVKVTEKFLVSMVPSGVVGDGMELKPESESVKISTGVAA